MLTPCGTPHSGGTQIPEEVGKAASAWHTAGCLQESKSAHTGSRGASPLLPGHGSLHVIKTPHASQHASANYTGLTRVSWKSKGFWLLQC